jgi:hypothetical protein
MGAVLYPEYKNRKIIPTKSAYRELEDLKMDLFEVLEILEAGYDCSRGKRREGITERCLRKRRKVFRAVIAEGQFLYPDGYTEAVYWLTHVSEETFKRRREK